MPDLLNQEVIYAELIAFFFDGAPKHLIYDPQEPRVDTVLFRFYEARDEYFRNELREAICLCFNRRSDRIYRDHRIFSDFLYLAKESRATQVVPILLSLARTRKYAHLSHEESVDIREQIIAILLNFNTGEQALDPIIEFNIRDPLLTPICLRAALKSNRGYKSFLDYINMALKVYSHGRHDKILRYKMSSVFRHVLSQLGDEEWTKDAKLLFAKSLPFDSALLDLLADAKLDPIITEYESIYELKINRPYRDEQSMSAFIKKSKYYTKSFSALTKQRCLRLKE